MPTLINHLSDMPDAFRQELFNYIDSSITKSSKKHTAYGLQQGFNSQNLSHTDLHISTTCFMEAMQACGYKPTPIPEKKADWHFFAKRI